MLKKLQEMANVWISTRALNNKLLFSLLGSIKTQNCRNLSRIATSKTLQTPKSSCSSGDVNVTLTLVTSHIQEHIKLPRGRSLIGVRHYGSHYENWTNIQYEDLVALISSGDIQLIDVREPKELQEQGTFPNALNIPLSSLTESLKLDDAVFTERYGRSKPLNHHTNIVFVGYGPVKSNTALEMAHKLGYKKYKDIHIEYVVSELKYLVDFVGVGHIPEALSSSPQTFKALYGEEKPDFDDENIVFACFLGKRSHRAMCIAHELGYTKARQYSGGYQEWHEKQTDKA